MNKKNLFENVVNPILEVGAYEHLWLNQKTSFKTIAKLFNNSESIPLPSSFVSEEDANKTAILVLKEFESKGIKSFGVRIHGTADYSPKLRDAIDPVELLYYQGAWELAESPNAIAVVGARKISNDGIRRARRLVKLLVQEGYTIFSGLAAGVDSEVHKTAIKYGGKTVAVIGTPICDNYPKQNQLLQREIAKNHLLISQVPVLRYKKQDWRFNRFFFPERNKTMSALTNATVIVEAAESSGTLIQATAAIDQGRKLFILDNCFHNKNISWPDKFLEKGAIRVKEIDDILLNLPKS